MERTQNKPVFAGLMAVLVLMSTLASTLLFAAAPIPVASGDSGSTVNILAWTAYADMSREYPNTIAAIDQYFTDYDLEVTTTTDANALRTALVGNNIFLFSEQENAGDLTTIGANFAGVLGDFVESGGTIVSCGGSGGRNIAFLDGTGLVELMYQNSASSGFATVEVTDHPVTLDVESPVECESAVYYCRTETDMEILVSYNGYPMVLAKDIGRGHIVYIAYDYYNYNSGAARLVSNAVQWLGNPGLETDKKLYSPGEEVRITAQSEEYAGVNLSVEKLDDEDNWQVIEILGGFSLGSDNTVTVSWEAPMSLGSVDYRIRANFSESHSATYGFEVKVFYNTRVFKDGVEADSFAPGDIVTVSTRVTGAGESPVMEYSLDSPHPYQDYYDNTWTIRPNPGAGEIRVHFDYIETEDSCDFVTIYFGLPG